MEPHDKRFSEFIDLLKSWISWKPESSSNVSRNFWMPDKSCRVCYECDSQFTIINRRHHCRICGRVFCAKCTPNSAVVSSEEAKKVGEVGERGRVCNYCFKRWEQELTSVDNGIQLCSPELSPTFSTSSLVSSKSSGTGNSNNSAVGTYSLVPYCVETVSSQLFQIESNNGKLENLMVNMDLDVEQQDPSAQVEFCMNRSDDEDDEYSAYHSDSEAQHFQSSSEYFNQVKYEEFDHAYQSKNEYISNENTNSNEVRPLDNIGYQCPLDEDKNGSNSFDSSPSSTIYNVDFENSKQLWYPPVPEDVEDERESTIFDDDDDDDGYEDASGEWGYLRSDSFSRDQSCEEHKQAMKNVVDGHFRALIAQLLQAENVPMGEENDKDSWMEIITALSWEAATLLKPDTSKGGGMDPGGYVKVKCIASGQRRESTVVRGVVCKKNVAHRRMSSRIEKPRFLILGGALEYHRVTNTLSSVDTLLQQEMDHLKMAVAKIASHHPSVLLVEKSVSRFAQDYLLAKNISLVLNIKRVLLERIARCTGAQIVPSVDHLMSQKLGYCDLFHVEKYFEEHANAAQGGKKSMKTLMFFEGCPKPLGCTILLKGAHRDELKKVKHVVHYGVFAAYHLALETSFLADEGASLPELPLKSPIAVALPDKPSSIARSISKFPKDNVPKLDLNKLNADEDKKVEIHDEQYDTTLASSPTVATIAASHNNVDLGDCHEIEGRSMCLDFNGLEDRKQTTEKQHQENKQVNDHESISEDYSASDHQSILVSLSSRCIWKGTVCERAHLFRIKYYGSFDKPLGRFLRDNLFDEGYQCRACEFPPEAHVHCYTHCQGSLTISVRKQDTLLPGERDGKIWMWHRCLKCPRVNGLPPATRRVVMSDAAWGLSFGKFLELSFSNNAAASRVASCGHSLHRDCLRFYGFGRTVACFRYASVSIHSVYLPPSKLDFNYQHQDWTQKDADEVAKMSELLFTEIHDKLHQIAESKLNSSSSNESESRSIVVILQETLKKEHAEFKDSLQKAMKGEMEKGRSIIDILEINKLRRQLLFQSYFWDQRLIHASNIIFKSKNMFGSTNMLSSLNVSSKPLKGCLSIDSPHSHPPSDEQINKSDIGKDQLVNKVPYLETDSSTVRRIQSDGQFLIMEGLSNTFDSKWSGDNVTTISDASKSNFEILFSDLYRSINKDENASKVEALNEYNPIYITSFKDLECQGGARLLLPTGVDDIVIPIYDDEPTSIISYVLVSNDYNSQMTDDCNPNYADGKPFESLKRTESTNDGILSSSSVLDAATHTKAHAKVSFSVDGSSGKVKYSVTCYFAKHFERLRKTCCPSEVDFVRSLSRCKKWGAQGGKSNVFFAKSLDERFIIKQVTKTELESFFTFALEYFKYLHESISTGSPTCLAKILGIYQITTKNMKLGKETRIDVLVMENLLFDRTVTKLYDLKGSLRSRYNPDSSGNNKVLLDQNLIEAMPTSPIFLGNKAKRLLERAVWNDTAFLAAIDVMDYSLLVGVDEEKHELVLGIIDFMRQYTWDKHLETWVKASGILGGPKNEAPTIISPQQYKKRFRKAMSAYFLVVPDQWSPSTIYANQVPARAK